MPLRTSTTNERLKLRNFKSHHSFFHSFFLSCRWRRHRSSLKAHFSDLTGKYTHTHTLKKKSELCGLSPGFCITWNTVHNTCAYMHISLSSSESLFSVERSKKKEEKKWRVVCRNELPVILTFYYYVFFCFREGRKPWPTGPGEESLSLQKRGRE